MVMSLRMAPRRRDLTVLAMFIAVSVLYTWPLAARLGSQIAVDTGDPTLNAAVLWWNATVIPFTPAWWNQPWFHPAQGVTTFTENLTGLWPIATPIYWISRSPVVTYNLTFLATWPLSAFAMYLLARRLTGRTDAAIVAGFAFAFAPYRASAELGHLQSLSTYWLPMALLGLHAWLEERRPRWLILFGVAWILQSLSNGYYLLFGSVLIGLWLVYFGTTRATWNAALQAAGAWVLASLVLLPVLLQYDRVHQQYGFTRTPGEAVAFSAHLDSFVQVSDRVAFWRNYLPAGKETLFPGLMVLVVVTAGVLFAVSRSNSESKPSARHRTLLVLAAVLALVAGTAVVVYLLSGPWSLRASGTKLFTMSDPYRAGAMFVLAAGFVVWKSRLIPALSARRPLIFYAAGTLIMAVFSCGPVLHAGGEALLDPAPYRWLMSVPGFDGLRVPSRFWMMGVFCLSLSAGLAYSGLARARGWPRYAIGTVVAAAVIAEGWLTAMPMAAPPVAWTAMAGTDPKLPLLDLPLGPRWDNAATFRITGHGRRLFNGVSGYDPPHYAPLEAGLRLRDPGMLAAMASLGPFEVSIEHANDPDGQWQQYVAAAGAVRIADDGARVIFRSPAVSMTETAVGPALQILKMEASRGDAAVLLDGNPTTHWVDGPQREGQWVLADLGQSQRVGGVSLAIGNQSMHIPRELVIEVSIDGASYVLRWSGKPAAAAVLAVLKDPRESWLRIAFDPTEARFVRIRQTGADRTLWVVPGLEINAPER